MSQKSGIPHQSPSQFPALSAVAIIVLLACFLVFDTQLQDLIDPDARVRRAEAAERKRASEEFVVVRRVAPVAEKPQRSPPAETPIAPRPEIVGDPDGYHPRVRALRPTEIFPGEGKPVRKVAQ